MKWQPIETAPKDQTVVILRNDMGYFDGWEDMAYRGYWNDGSGSWSRCSDMKYNPQNPTHWMPLPNPPERES